MEEPVALLVEVPRDRRGVRLAPTVGADGLRVQVDDAKPRPQCDDQPEPDPPFSDWHTPPYQPTVAPRTVAEDRQVPLKKFRLTRVVRVSTGT